MKPRKTYYVDLRLITLDYFQLVQFNRSLFIELKKRKAPVRASINSEIIPDDGWELEINVTLDNMIKCTFELVAND